MYILLFTMGKLFITIVLLHFQLERDLFEEKIYRYSQLNKLPVLGICRGMQLINVLEGGKLIQDLDNGNARHKKEESDKVHSNYC